MAKWGIPTVKRAFAAVVLVTIVAATSLVGDAAAQAPGPPSKGSAAPAGLIGPLADLSLQSTRLEAAAQSVAPGAQTSRAERIAAWTALGQLRIDDGGAVQVRAVIEGEGPDSEALAAMGVVVEHSFPAYGLAQYWVPQESLAAVARLDGVVSLSPPRYAFGQSGSLLSEGDGVHRADEARERFGLTGEGVRVGVISDGILGLEASIASGDAPELFASESFISLTDPDLLAGAEGTAMIEIVHDIAPGAALSSANTDTDLGMIDAVNFLAERNDIVVDDLGFFFPANGLSAVSRNTAAALNNPEWPIRAYFTAVGNSAQQHYREPFDPVSPFGLRLPAPGQVQSFHATDQTSDVLGRGTQQYNEIFLDTGTGVLLLLFWDALPGEYESDYDLYLLDTSNRIVEASVAGQTAVRGEPFEAIAFTNTGPSDFFRVVVQNFADLSPPHTIELFAFFAPPLPVPQLEAQPPVFNYNTPAGSIIGQGDAGGSVISVGAVDQETPDAIEFFSSHGPTADGRMKPEIVAVDGVTVTGNGGFGRPIDESDAAAGSRFFGSSAAAPHAAAMAALLAEARPELLGPDGDAANERALMRALILNSAIDLGEPGPENVFGYGRADTLTALELLPVAGFTIPETQRVPIGGSSTVTVTVLDINGNPYSGAMVELTGPEDQPLLTAAAGAELTTAAVTTTTTAADGQVGVRFDGLSLGVEEITFRVLLAFAGELVDTGIGGTIQVDIVQAQGGIDRVPLQPGWNNVGWGGRPTPAEEALAPIAPAIGRVWAWDPATRTWLSWSPRAPAVVNTLSVIQSGQSLWIFVTAQQTIFWEPPPPSIAED